MKRFTLIYTFFLLAVALPLLTACYNDDNIFEKETNDGKVSVRLRISQAGAAVTRAGSATKDSYATPEELMNVWTVVITDNDGDVKHILTCEPAKEDREIDPIETELELETGTYHFYSFANISPKYVEYLLGITSQKPTADETFIGVSQGTIKDITPTSTATITNAEAKTIAINGNGFNINAENNDFLSKGIPMSNVQTIEVTQPTDGATTAQVIDLIVVRLLAKIELQIYNDKGTDLNIKSITLTDITENASENSGGTANLKLFPYYTFETPNGANEKVDYKHGDIHPNIATGVTTTDLTITPSSSGVTVTPVAATQSDKWAISSTTNKYVENNGYPDKEKAVVISFYVNESATPTHDFKHFFLELEIEGDENATLIDDKKQRYTLIGGVGETYTEDNPDEWNYIARNDYRIIPIVLDDYKLDLIPYDFPAIGVYPASVKEEDGIYTINFHDYGHFHLLPQVTKYSAPTDYVSFTSTTPVAPYTDTTWGLVNNSFEDSWKSWTDATKTQSYNNATVDNPFYRTGYDTTNPIDGDEVGGEPVWYANTNQWQPNETIGYQPFIFGYINQHPKPSENQPLEDRKVYHEFTINLYKSGTGAARQMTYRLYMLLDTEQMLYSRSLGAPATRHTHGH